ncbi:hypothetical protein FJT64_026308 [Amphibalanus amphitrite]|uniref:Uncharacterized protein n=1 Tax=Amphibalanus amphitrite TaxID=1232801 RepID=A0A6A4W7U9_AMPAM|nr:hypothetical protein FJT64_026308 [Amphibalanus amphitrite]
MNPLVVLSALVAVACAAPGHYNLAATYAAAPALTYAAALPHAVTYSHVNAAVPGPVPDNGLSPGLDALVKKTAISAAGRPVTRIQPHITRTVPEITHKQVDVAVPVPRPVARKVPVPVAAPYAVTPVVETTEVVQPVVQPVVRHAVSTYSAPAYGYGYAAPAHGYAAPAYGYAAPAHVAVSEW